MQSYRLQITQLVLTAVLVVLLIGGLGAEREAVPVSAAQPAQAVPMYLMVPAVAFLPESPTTGYLVFWGDLSVPQDSPNGYSTFYAPVYLPQGARLTGITMYYHDTNDDAYTLGVDFLRKPLPSLSSGQSLGLNVYSNPTPNDFGLSQSDTTPDAARAVVDNSQYAYWLRVYIYAAPHICSCRLCASITPSA